ncbi:hypothetical protein PsYK624_123410 [Phanerochaete sordida]|uniref:Uncharacterized protein n=1 Tax=Phanerochaete sordida TaxID=48140 RepID=A0A9P3LIG9_9APHY|nr:hypothetical protein PsYK624_123410 [Phanerochaete sordida]
MDLSLLTLHHRKLIPKCHIDLSIQSQCQLDSKSDINQGECPQKVGLGVRHSLLSACRIRGGGTSGFHPSLRDTQRAPEQPDISWSVRFLPLIGAAPQLCALLVRDGPLAPDILALCARLTQEMVTNPERSPRELLGSLEPSFSLRIDREGCADVVNGSPTAWMLDMFDAGAKERVVGAPAGSATLPVTVRLTSP